ncbi:MAG: hypothetical protein GY869_28185 [Planctomycetes bacterium]|nr:hypothetical protein [Planctomycetota bacterium]
MTNNKMFMIQLFLVCSVLLIGGTLAHNPPGSSNIDDTNAEQLQQMLGNAYVDIRVGFAVRPPFGCEIGSLNGTKTPSPETSIAHPGGIAEWELLKYPESKTLVQFVDQDKQQLFTVSQLVTKQPRDIETVLTERQNFWKKYPNQATLRDSGSEILNDRPTALLTLSWRPEPGDPNQMIIYEGLVQQERDRYFLLTLVLTSSGGQAASIDEILMNSIMWNFECMSRQEQRLRWEQGRKRAELFLTELKFKNMEQKLEEEVWFRLLKEGADVGYLQMTGKKTGLPTSGTDDQQIPEKPQAELVIEIMGYAQEPKDAIRLSRMLDCGQNLTNGNGDSETAIEQSAELMNQTKIIEVKFKTRLTDKLNQEFFETQCTAAEAQGYRETGEWHEIMLKANRYDDLKNPDQSMTEIQDVNPRLYLPGVARHLLGRLIESETGHEYVFIRYSNRAIRYFVVRVAGRRDLEAETEKKTETGQIEVTRDKISCLYVIAQAGAEGPIIETWLDQEGKTLKQRFEGLTLLRTTGDTIKKLWPGRILDRDNIQNPNY